MERSTGPVLTTHTGSLPRTKALLELMVALSRREPVDEAAFAREADEGADRAGARLFGRP